MADHHHHRKTGIISRIRLENFMCHGNLEIEFGDYVNFITGQNGSGKSAILTALCVAFGSRARGTQRANTLKDFIRTGCSYALVRVELRNHGPEAFKPDMYGDIIVVERRIYESTSSITLKNRQGRKMGTKRDDLREVIEHFNIDVENPCVIMSQDKSREFLHSGNAKDKFKFFYRATLLQRVEDLLHSMERQLSDATAQLHDLEQSLSPALKDLDKLKDKIKGRESVENDSLELKLVGKKLAWANVYDTERQISEKSKEIEKLTARKLFCQQKIDKKRNKKNELSDQVKKKESEIADIDEMTPKEEDVALAESLFSTAKREEYILESDKGRTSSRIEDIDQKIVSLTEKIRASHEQHIKETQAEKYETEEKLRKLEADLGKAKDTYQSLQANEDEITKRMAPIEKDIKDVSYKIQRLEEYKSSRISDLQKYQGYQGTKFGAFGGRQVTNIWQAIEHNQNRFSCHPIGPIGMHVKLLNGDKWSIAVETAVGKLLDAFIVTNYEDARTLRDCARRAGHRYLRIIIYEFSRPRLEISPYMLPDHPTVLSVLHTDHNIVRNVLIDVGNAEMQVIVEDYNVGKTIAFDPNIKNVKAVFTLCGQKMFQRRSAQIILPPDLKLRNRLCVSYNDQISKCESERDALKVQIQENQLLMSTKKNELNNLRESLTSIQKSKKSENQNVRLLEFELEDFRKSLAAEADTAPSLNVDESNKEISALCEEKRGKEIMLEELKIKILEAAQKAADCNASLTKIYDSKEAMRVALLKAVNELVTLEENLSKATGKEIRYKNAECGVLTNLENAEAEYVNLGDKIKEERCKASKICPESDLKDLNREDTDLEHLSAKYTRLTNQIAHGRESFPEPIEEVRMEFERKQRKISRKQETYEALREKLEVCEKALDLRFIKLKRNEITWVRELRQKFSGHLVKKGIQGKIRVNVEEKILSIEVTMPQDASNTAVCDTRGLSGGERSFSTLCFALTIHGMTEAPFRAMDEFDVFMDAVSRKISLDAVVDFALEEGSQWIFITPHDISMVRDHERIKKQQMAAPRG